MRFRLQHKTSYSYSGQASRCLNRVYLEPRNTLIQTCIHFDLVVQPEAEHISRTQDYFGNVQHHVSCDEAHQVFSLLGISEVETQPTPDIPEAYARYTCADVLRLLNESTDPQDRLANEFTTPSPMIPWLPEAAEYAQSFFEPGHVFLDSVMAFIKWIHHDFVYDPDATDLATSVSQALSAKRGVCQDFAHIAISALRTLGFAARYVSGYLETLPPPGQEKLVGADASHAWLSVYLPGFGWVDFDPTNAKQPDEQYITLALGRDYSDVSPVSGVIFGGGEQVLSVAVDVTRLD